MSKSLAVTSVNGLGLREMGEVMARSGFFSDAKDAAQAIVKVQAGGELGFPPVASMMGIHIIKGKVSMSANIMAAAIKRYDAGKYNYRVKEHTPEACELEFFEKGQSVGTSRFTKQDAAKAGTQNMDRYPRNMLFARAMSNGAKWFCPDVFGGPVYTPEELGAEVDEEGQPVNVLPPPPPQRSTPALTAGPADPSSITEGKVRFANTIREWAGVKPEDFRAACGDWATAHGVTKPLETLTEAEYATLADAADVARDGGLTYIQALDALKEKA